MPTPRPAPRVSNDPGRLRGVQRALSDDGFFEILAIDHGLDIAALLADDPALVDFGEITQVKDLVIRAARDDVSAVLVDAAHGAHLIASGAIGARTGLVVGVEDEDYRIPPGPRATRLREGWSAQQAHNMGADLAKLLWWFRSDTASAEDQRAVLHQVVTDAHAASIPVVVEPIWYPLPDEQPDTAAWKQARTRGIIESAVAIDQAGADVLKLEFPGEIDTEVARAAARDAAEEITARTSAPWTILTAGVDFESFAIQLEIASAAGASGYLAGRAIWRDLIGVGGGRWEDAARSVRGRFARLNEIMATNGRSVVTARRIDDSIADIGARWYDRSALASAGTTQPKE